MNDNKMDKSGALLQLDNAVFDALISITNNVAKQQLITECANKAANAINNGQNIDFVLNNAIAYISNNIDEAESKQSKAVEVAVTSTYGIKQLNANQSKLLSVIVTDIEKNGIVSDASMPQVKAFIDTLNLQLNSNSIETFTAIVEDAYDNWQNVLADESSIGAIAGYASTFDGSFIGNRAVNCMAYVEKCNAADNQTAIVTDLHKLIKAQRTPSALLANEFRLQLQNQFKDWQNAMLYGAKHGGSQIQSNLQSSLLASTNEVMHSTAEIIDLINTIASDFSCAASITEFSNANGKKALRIKFLSHFMQADESTYSAIQTILASLNANSTLSIKQGTQFLIMEIEPCNLKNIIYNKTCAIAACEAILCKSPFCSIILPWFDQMLQTNTNWWRYILNLHAFMSDETAMLSYAWSKLNPDARVFKLKQLGQIGSDFLSTITVQDLHDMQMSALPIDIQSNLSSSII